LGVAAAGWCFITYSVPASPIVGGADADADIATRLAKEYQAWLISRALLRVVCSTSNQGCRMLLEGWIINSVPDSVDRFYERGGGGAVCAPPPQLS
jgi:hypothetical protein